MTTCLPMAFQDIKCVMITFRTLRDSVKLMKRIAGTKILERLWKNVIFPWNDWLAYHVCHYKHHNANYGMACKTTELVSAPNLMLFGRLKTELQVKEVEEFSSQLRYMIGKLACSFAHQHSCLNINVWRFSKLGAAVNSCFYWYIDRKLAETFQHWVIKIL